MLESPLAFFRGSAIVQAADLAGTPASGIHVQLCGDCHLMNFGGFASPERDLVFDLNDFDETLSGPWEWDLKRLCTSFVLAARWRKLSESEALDAALNVALRYREMMAAYAGMPAMEIWYDRVTFAKVLSSARDDRRLSQHLQAGAERAQRSTSEHVFGKLTAERNGEVGIVDRPPLLFHPNYDLLSAADEFLKIYAQTLHEDQRSLLRRFRAVDAAIKVVGVGSVGTRCFVALLLDELDQPLFLQMKEARRSVLEDYAGESPWRNHGERVVVGQRLLQAVSDIFLGWSRGASGRDYYVRQLRDMKISAELELFDATVMSRYATLCGGTLARAHAKAGAAAAIAGYLGRSNAFDVAVAKYAVAYADQVERDYEAFAEAVQRGEFATETSASLAENATI